MLHGTKKIIKQKAGLLNLAEELGNVSQACRIMWISTPSSSPCLRSENRKPIFLR